MTNKEAKEKLYKEWQKFLEDNIDYAGVSEAYKMAFNALDQEQTRQWIPVSEDLPKKSGNYWCTFGGTYLTGSDYYTTESDAKKIFDDAAEEYVGWQSRNVIAWMLPPEPWKGDL